MNQRNVEAQGSQAGWLTDWVCAQSILREDKCPPKQLSSFQRFRECKNAMEVGCWSFTMRCYRNYAPDVWLILWITVTLCVTAPQKYFLFHLSRSFLVCLFVYSPLRQLLPPIFWLLHADTYIICSCQNVLLFCIVVVVVIFVDVVATVLLLWTARFLSPVNSNDIKTHINIYYKWAYFWFIYIKFKWNDNNNDSDDSQNENWLHGTNRQRAHNEYTELGECQSWNTSKARLSGIDSRRTRLRVRVIVIAIIQYLPRFNSINHFNRCRKIELQYDWLIPLINDSHKVKTKRFECK